MSGEGHPTEPGIVSTLCQERVQLLQGTATISSAEQKFSEIENLVPVARLFSERLREPLHFCHVRAVVVKTALITGPATLPSPFYPSARRGGLNGAGGRSTDCKIAANIERGF